MIHRENQGPVTILRMEHGKANTLDIVFLNALREALVDLGHETRAVVLTGRGQMFSAGIDLKTLLDSGPDYTLQLVDALNELLEGFLRLSVPSVAAINGHAIAGGFILACACDVRILADGAGKLGLTELLLGVPFPPLALEIVRSAIGHTRTRRMVITAQLYSASEACRLELVDELAGPDSVTERALEIASQLAGIPRPTYELTKRQLLAPLRLRLQGLEDDLVDATRRQWVASETVEVMRRFVAERLG